MSAITVFDLLEQGPGKPLADSQIEAQLRSGEGVFWIHCLLNSNTRRQLKKITTIPSFILDILCDEENRPHLFMYDDSIIASLRTVSFSNGSPEKVKSLRLWVKKNVVITVQREKSDNVAELEQALRNGKAPKKTSNFFLYLLDGISEKIEAVVCHLGDKVDEIADELAAFNGEKEVRDMLNKVRRRIGTLRRYLIPQREAINKIRIDALSWLNPPDDIHLREKADEIVRLIEDLDTERERATIMHEELFALSQEKINKKMYLLAILASIFLPISFVTSLLGINVGGIPGSGFKYAFWIVCGILGLVVIIEYCLFRFRKWV